MSLKKFYSLIICFIISNAWSQAHFPGGVAGAETWYIVDYTNLSQSLYPNLSDPYIRLSSCGQSIGNPALFNFNHSVMSTGLCLTYNAPLEINSSRNVFFVGEPQELTVNYAHLSTFWRTDMPSIILPAWIHRYRFDLANKGAYENDNTTLFESISKANINFYHWNLYQSDKRFKSFGLNGETQFFIGKNFTNTTVTPTFQGQAFSGNFPEFISYPFELTWNQKNRVESYLALKYGITLANGTPYRNATNTVFWNPVNYIKFGSRIFGIGRDDISGLNQLQSESVHNKDYLIASVRKLYETNPLKQEVESIENNHFIVFGDNNQPDGLQNENAQHVRPLKRIWLSQNLGEQANHYNIFFKLNLQYAINQAMTADSDLKLWMLHDKYVNNQTTSTFSSQYVDYYDTVSMSGLQYGFFENVFFDTDNGVYDQFTFGVGPEMIVQVRFELGDCDDERIKSYVVITGGRAPYNINIQNTGSYDQNFTVSDQTMSFEAIAPDTYTVHVTDANGLEGEAVVDVAQQQVLVNLGNNIVLNSSQQQATLNAGTNVLDPTATYQWWKDDVLLDYVSPSITVTEPGTYTVVVTSGNRMCQETSSVSVGYNFTGSAYAIIQCEDEYGSIASSTSGGIPPFTTTISGSSLTISQVHNTTTCTIPDLPPDDYIVTTTDSSGNLFQTIVEVPDMLDGIDLNLQAQVAQFCQSWPYNGSVPGYFCANTIFLDASELVTNPNVSYEWLENGQSVGTGIYVPEVEIYKDGELTGDPAGYNEYQVIITNLETGCSITETVAITRNFKIQAAEGSARAARKADETDATGITARVYPNPSDVNSTFYYEVISTEEFSGTVSLYSPNGAVLYETTVSGQSNYKIPLSLTTSGTYLAVTRSGEKTLTNKIIIK